MLDRTIAPPFAKTSSFNLVTPEEKKLPNGVEVFLVRGGSQEVLKVELVFPSGRWYEEKLAAAYFTAQLLSKGTQDKSSFEIARIFDQYGAHLEISPGHDFVSVSLYALNKNLAPVLRLLIEILSTPVFPKKEFAQTRDVFVQNLKINNEKTSFVASQVFRRKLFGKHHPYGAEVEERDVKALEVSDFENHFAQYLHSPRIFVSGRINASNEVLMLEQFHALRSGTTPTSPEHGISEDGQYEYVKRPDSVQSSVRIGKRSLLRSHPDYVPLLFVSHVLGGYFGSRLMKNIREDKGLTYGISASVHAQKHAANLIIGTDVNKANVDLTFDEIRKELKILRTDPISSEELETTRNHFIGSLQSEITTPFAHAEKIKTIKLFGLQSDHYQKMIRRIEAITAAEIAETSEKYLHEDSFVRVAVG